jgi:serine/threonine protein kinase
MAKCKQCGFELSANVRYCPNCATKVETQPPAEAAGAFTDTISGTGTVFVPERKDTSTDLETGKEFHRRYVIDQKLGQGAMGVVYLASDKLTNRRIALKLINPALVNSTSARERFIREGLIARDIRHKNVVAVYDVSETDGQLYLAMEFLSGVTLRNWLHRVIQSGYDVPFDTAERVIRNILEGLEAAHTTGVIHRDVKPENIMFTGNLEAGDYSLKILDFGIARAIVDSAAKQLTTTSTSTGTLLYMAPEQKTAADTVGPPADLYAVTAIFYELLLGVAPTGRWSALSKDREDLPVAIDAVIDKGLSSRPRSRYQTAQEYLKALNEIRNVPLHSHLHPSGSYSSNVGVPGIKAPTGNVQTPIAGSGSANIPRSSPATSAGFAPTQPAAAQRQPFTAHTTAPAPQIITVRGRVRTEALVWSNAPAEGLFQSAWQVLSSFGAKNLQSDPQTRTIRGNTGFTLRSLGQRITANVEEISGGSTINIADQTMGPGLTDLGRSKDEVHLITGMLIHKLAGDGWKAHIVREIHRSFPVWLVTLIVLGGLILLGLISDYIDNY